MNLMMMMKEDRQIGYTHYWYRKPEVPENTMQAIVADFNQLVLVLDDMGVKLAGGLGEGLPTISTDTVWFNGPENCGHAQRDFGIAWPSKGAHGVGANAQVVDGDWFGGLTLNQRACGGDCSH